MDLKTGDKVKIIAGVNKGKEGFISEIQPLFFDNVIHIAVSLSDSHGAYVEKDYIQKIEDPRINHTTITSAWKPPQYYPSRRDYFIAAAMKVFNGSLYTHPEETVKAVLKYVDILMAELEKTEKK